MEQNKRISSNSIYSLLGIISDNLEDGGGGGLETSALFYTCASGGGWTVGGSQVNILIEPNTVRLNDLYRRGTYQILNNLGVAKSQSQIIC